jgi:hypothetical protein
MAELTKSQSVKQSVARFGNTLSDKLKIVGSKTARGETQVIAPRENANPRCS